ncbi:hypothetical protein ACS0TY_020529 [Phlomoides rotata]
MGSFSGLGIGLSFIFGCILMGIVAQLYYLLWWKKRVVANSPTKTQDFSFLFCWKTHTCFQFTNSVRNPLEQEDLEVGSSKNSEGVDLELMRMHNLCGPPRFLFPITEESKEDMESEDGRSRKGIKSLNATPLSSPLVKSPTFSASFNTHGFNPLFESITEAQLNRLRSSPPPTFKFLKDAEDKFIRKLFMEVADQEDAPFVKFSNQSPQVLLPLPSSPTVLDHKSSVH